MDNLRIAIVEGRVVRDADYTNENEISFEIGIQEVSYSDKNKRYETKTTFIPIVYSGANVNLYRSNISKDVKVRAIGNISSREVFDALYRKYRHEIIVIANELQFSQDLNQKW